MSIKSLCIASARPSRDASASSWLARRSIEEFGKLWAAGGAGRVRVDACDSEVEAGGNIGEWGRMVDMNDNRGEGMIGNRTGGRSETGVGTSGRVIDGAGFGEGNDSPDLLRTAEHRGEGGGWYAKRGPHLLKIHVSGLTTG